MTSSDELQWINVDDFSPGIWSPRYGSANISKQAPLGAAQPTDTFRCIATAAGALGPGPGLEYSFDQAMLGTGTRPATEARMVVTSSHYTGPHAAYDETTHAVTYGTRPDGLYLTFSYFNDPASGTAYQQGHAGYLYKLWTGSPPGTFNVFTGASSAKQGGGAYVAPFKHSAHDWAESVQTGGFGIPYKSLAMIYTHFGSDAGTYGILVVPATFGDDDTHDRAKPGGWPGLIVGHQGRIVMVTNALSDDTLGEVFLNNMILSALNDLQYFPVRDHYSGAVSNFFRPIEENQSGIRVIASMNANELIVIKATGGGAIIRGDIANPTVTRLPGLHSVGNIYCKPAVTPIGLVYGGERGVYVWPGGDKTARISHQLDLGSFWLTDDSDAGGTINRVGLNGQFAYLDPWVLVPNNWMYDTRFDSWWRLESPLARKPYFSMHATVGNAFFGVPAYVSVAQPVAADRYSFSSDQVSFSWRSQPITPAVNRAIKISEVVILAQGDGRITVTLTSETETSPAIATTINSATRLAVIRLRDLGLQGESFDVKIFSESLTGGGAPVIHGFRLGWQPINQRLA